MNQSLRLVVVTASLGREADLFAKLASLQRQTLDSETFAWSVHLNLTPSQAEGLAARLAAEAHPVQLHVTGGEVLPVGAARNRAAAAVPCNTILLSDDDVTHDPEALEAHATFHEARRTQGERPAVAVGALTLPDSFRIDKEREPFERPARLGRHASWINATGANTSLPKSVFDAVGGYDPHWDGYGGEDPELFVRVARTGVRFRHLAAGRGHHSGRTLEDVDKARAAGAAHTHVARRHGGDVAWWLGVHPFLLAVKTVVHQGPWSRLVNPRILAYERAYAEGARHAWSEPERRMPSS